MTSLHIAEHRRTARRAGLKYVTDGVDGISRQRAGKGWSFIGSDGVRISDPDERRRIKSLAIPPSWTDVWICPHPKGHIQATGRDARGRKQYRYHPRYREERDKSKFRRLMEMSEVLPAIREQVERDLCAPELSRRQILATVVLLLDKTLMRVGNDEYVKENRSFGLTTLRRQHVKVEGATLRFSQSRRPAECSWSSIIKERANKTKKGVPEPARPLAWSHPLCRASPSPHG